MTGKRHSQRRGGRRPIMPSVLGEAIILDRIAQLVRSELGRRRVDLAPLPELAAVLGVDATTMQAAVARHPGLGLVGPGEDLQVWSLPSAPMTAGFRPTLLGDRLVLQLPPEHEGQALLISGKYLGPPAREPNPADPASAVGGELGYTIMRLTMMAHRWLTLPAEGSRTRHLFGLIARTWRNSPEPVWASGDLHVHHFDLTRPFGVPYWNGGHPTSHLEIVVWAENPASPELVNVYPSGTHRTIFGMAETR